MAGSPCACGVFIPKRQIILAISPASQPAKPCPPRLAQIILTRLPARPAPPSPGAGCQGSGDGGNWISGPGNLNGPGQGSGDAVMGEIEGWGWEFHDGARKTGTLARGQVLPQWGKPGTGAGDRLFGWRRPGFGPGQDGLCGRSG